MSEENTDNPTNSSDSNQKKTENPTPKSNDNSVLLEKIDALHADLRKERDKIKSLTTERDELNGKVTSFTVKEKKQNALNKALAGIGEDFEVPSEKLTELNDLVNDLRDSDDLESKIEKFVGLVKETKVKPGQLNTPSLPKGGEENKASKTDAESLYELAKTNPDAFRAAVAEKFKRR